MKILVTGSAGFIGSSLVLTLLNRGCIVCGVDNHNDYYDPYLKEARIKRFLNHNNYNHLRIDIIDKKSINTAFEKFMPDCVVNLAAQAGVRYSIENPMAYIESNVVGFGNILECCRKFRVKHLIYASSSSVYGANTKMPFSIKHNVDHPLSFYAATKKTNELLAHSYSHLYDLPTTGLRFFTVYGPWGRPDMALFKFTEAIINAQPLSVYNHGKHKRDFTYIDDIIESIYRLIYHPARGNSSWDSSCPDPGTSLAPWRIFNIGNASPVELMDYIRLLENAIGKKAILDFLPMQIGDVPDTYADTQELVREINFKPKVSIEEGIPNFVAWYKDYYKNK
jgi:UDP-glucuronate 4-epimerase